MMIVRWFSSIALVLLFFVQQTSAQHLPIRSYTPADGLPSSFVQHIFRDSRGYLWISTRNGVSRFDGYQFITYGIEQGLSHPTVNFVLQTRHGDYWIATNGGGICRFFPNGDPEGKNSDFVSMLSCWKFRGDE
jgi:ligand-binding sensor domain-containing protein